jgi:hypothetical protein
MSCRFSVNALALIRQAEFVNAAQARRFFAAHLSAVFSLLVTPFSCFVTAMGNWVLFVNIE